MITIGRFDLLGPGELLGGSIPLRLLPSPSADLYRNRVVYGQGWHQDTQWYLRQVGELVKPGMAVLDFGAGTGILAIAAAKLGAEVTACEILPEALELCRLNAELNDVKIVITETLPDGSSLQDFQFDLIFMNMGQEGTQYAEKLQALLRPDGRLIWTS